MTRTEYIKIRKLQALNSLVHYHFYRLTGKILETKSFLAFFQRYLFANPTINWNLLWSMYDNEYELTFLMTKDNKIIKIY